MTQKDICAFYKTLTRGEKGRFTAFVSLQLGGSPHTWQYKFLRWERGLAKSPMPPVIGRELCSIIESGSWKLPTE